MFDISKAADLNQFVQGGQLYRAFHFSEGFLDNGILIFLNNIFLGTLTEGKGSVWLTSSFKTSCFVKKCIMKRT
jgi:hypothetical protein